MATRNFMELLRVRMAAGFSVCIGLDSNYVQLPEHIRQSYKGMEKPVEFFNEGIIGATREVALAYKPNIAFYPDEERRAALAASIQKCFEMAPYAPVILDAKRADIGDTNIGYAEEVFDVFKADAVTVNPYFGPNSLKPFFERQDKGIIVLCRTSNPGAEWLQNRLMQVPEDVLLSAFPKGFEHVMHRCGWLNVHIGLTLVPMYQYVAIEIARHCNVNNNCALVIGATAADELGKVRYLLDQMGSDIPILVPGIGKQGGDLEKAVKAGQNKDKSGLIISSSSGIIFASGGSDYAAAARKKATELHEQVLKIRTQAA